MKTLDHSNILADAQKTALARALFHNTDIRGHFGRHCALVSVGPPAAEEAADHKRLLDIQNSLLHDLFGGGPARNLKEGCQLLGLRTTKVLVILDDVWRASDISQLLPIDRLEPGSCVIATSRRVDLLTRCTTVSSEFCLPFISSVLYRCIRDRRELSRSNPRASP